MTWTRKHPIIATFLGLLLLLFVIAGITGKSPSKKRASPTAKLSNQLPATTSKPVPAATSKVRPHKPKKTRPASPPLKRCSPFFKAGSTTSCPFAQAVFTAFVSSEEKNGSKMLKQVSAYSPVTHENYTLKCTNYGGYVACTGGRGAVVSFQARDALAGRGVRSTPSAPPPQQQPQPQPSVESPGSSSHATDSQFCSIHSCIENFPNGNGYIVQCSDGTWSHSGGLSGACSDHGGEA